MNLKEMRKNSGLRVEEVAAVVGVSHSTVHNWENGRTVPKMRIDQFEKILELYGCNFGELVKAYQESTKQKTSC